MIFSYIRFFIKIPVWKIYLLYTWFTLEKKNTNQDTVLTFFLGEKREKFSHLFDLWISFFLFFYRERHIFTNPVIHGVHIFARRSNSELWSFLSMQKSLFKSYFATSLVNSWHESRALWNFLNTFFLKLYPSA